MILFRQFNVFAESRGDGLHPKLRALVERAAASLFSEASMRRDDLIAAGPGPSSLITGQPGAVFARAGAPRCRYDRPGTAPGLESNMRHEHTV
jgi:hypothetical protein